MRAEVGARGDDLQVKGEWIFLSNLFWEHCQLETGSTTDIFINN